MKLLEDCRTTASGDLIFFNCPVCGILQGSTEPPEPHFLNRVCPECYNRNYSRVGTAIIKKIVRTGPNKRRYSENNNRIKLSRY